MPIPNETETREEFVARYMSSEEAKKDFPDAKQRLAVAYSEWRKFKKGKKEFRFSYKSITDLNNEEELIVKGYIATTHFDGQDIITKDTLDSWAKEINEGNPRANKVSVNHDRVPHVAGVGIKGTARVDVLPDGEYGLYVETLVDKTKENYEEIKYRIDNDFLDSFSIEYIAPEEVKVDSATGARVLGIDTMLYGWTLASQPMNEHAVMVKELFKNKLKEDVKMPETKEEVKTTEVKESLSADELNDYRVFKSMKEKEAKEAKEKEAKEQIKSEILKELKEVKVEEKVMKTPSNIEMKEYIEYKEAIKSESKLTPEYKFRVAAKFAEKVGLISASGVKESQRFCEQRAAEGKLSFECKQVGSRHIIESKALGITTNQNTDTDYLLSAAELADVFDPVIYNYLNQSTMAWNVLAKDDYSNKGNNQVQFTIKTGKNSTAAAYTGNAINTGNVGRLKLMTKFKKYQVGVEVDGDMIAAARGGPIGDVFAQEVMDSSADLLEVMDAALFAEVGLETASGVIGFEYICDSAGNTSLYNLTRSTTNQLAPDSAGNTYINGASADISLANLRAAIRNAKTEGANQSNLVFFTSYTQEDKFKQVYDAAERHPAPTSTRFGFEGMMTFEGVPIYGCKNCNSDDWFLVDLETHRIAIWVPPTLEMLGKDADSQKGFIKSYWCTYNRAPRRMVMIYGNATS